MDKLKFERKEFINFRDRDSDSLFSDYEFTRCYFESCSISLGTNPELRSIIKNVRLLNCEVRGCSLRAAIVEDSEVDGLKTNGLFQVWGAVFKHVRLRGKIDRLMISPFISPSYAGTVIQKKFDIANAKYYETVDWALDISKAEFKECDIRGLPSKFIIRDPATQIVVTRAKAQQGLWRQVDLSGTYWSTYLEILLEREDPDIVLAAPKRDPKFLKLLEGLNKLREAGIAEPD